MAIGYIRETNNSSTGTTSLSITPASSVASGTLLVLYVAEGLGSGVSTVSVSDTSSNTWSKFIEGGCGSEATSHTVSGWYAVMNSTNTPTISVAPSASTSVRTSLTEYSGTWGSAPFDAGKSSASAGTGPRNTGSITPTAADALLVAFCFANLGATYSSAGTGFTLLTLNNSRAIAAYQIATTVAAYSAEFAYTSTARTSGAAIGAFVESSASGPTPTPAFGRYGVRSPSR